MNQLLSGLPEAELTRLWPRLTRVALRAGQSLDPAPGQRVACYFPETCVVAVAGLAGPRDHSLEVAIIGRQGAVGTRWLLADPAEDGPGAAAPAEAGDTARVQVPGIAYSVPVAGLRAMLGDLPVLRGRLMADIAGLAAQFVRSAVCVSNHTIGQRLARRLLLACDHGGGNVLPITQEHLAGMLSVRRSGVSVVLNLMEAEGLVSLSRGHIAVRDRPALLGHACGCYRPPPNA